ncbi:MAG TPA: beta-ketoacyl-ACP synthase III, partial [Tepidisphaeraceae bacterium]|nr:beta-ketoacyl-ACP synthase III [Tepidisphaeraceae bacterium]
KRLTNAELSKMVATDDEWIVQRTGIRERRIAGPTETTASLSSHAATKALKSAGLEPKDIDLIILATATPEMAVPSTACFVAASLGLDETPAFDVSAACSGFLFAFDTAAAYIQAGRHKNILVIGAETLSRITDYTDRSSCILFGDGAGAVVLQRAEGGQRGVMYSSLHADGHGWDFIYCPQGSRHPIDAQMVAARSMFMKLKGREVYKFAVDRFTSLIEDAMKKCELKRQDIKLIIPHQVNQRIIDSSLEKLGFSPDAAFVNIAKYGNTSSASIPIALDEAIKAGRLMKGDVAVFVAFGAGLTWANAVVRI